MKVSSTFSKVAGSRDSVPGRAPQSAELSCAYLSAGGGPRGNPRRGFPLLFVLWVCACAPIRWEVVVSLSCHSTPFLWCLPKETVSSRQRKALFYLGGSTIRVSATSRWSGRSSPDFGRGLVLVGGMCVCAVFLGRSLFHLLPIPPHFFALAQRNGVEPQRNALKGAATGGVGSHPPLPRTRSPNITADCVKLTLPGRLTNRPQTNLTHQFVPLGLTPKWERRAGPPRRCGGFKALFFGGSTPFLWASTKEMGSNGREV